MTVHLSILPGWCRKINFNESPVITKSMRIALNDLQLDHLWVIYPGQHTYPVDEKITVMPISEIFNLKQLHKI